MRTSIIQLAALVFAFSVTAIPLMERDGDKELTKYTSNGAGDDKYLAAASTTKKSSKAKTTKKSSKATATKKPSKTKTKKTKKPKATGTKKKPKKPSTTAADTAPTSDAGSDSGSPDADKTAKSGSTKTASSGSAATTKATTTGGGSSGSSGGSLPASSGTSVLSAVQTIAAGGTFDGGMVMFDRGVSCSQGEGGGSDAVFSIEAGGSISNVIIGPNQIEGIHCEGACKLTNVWWSAVCEDALTVKNQEASATTTISGGGAFGAGDKVVQHNGGGTISISDFTVGTFGKLYRACGNCATSFERHVIMDGITATTGSVLAGINSNFGDTATITNSKLSGVKSICTTYQGVAKGNEPSTLTSNEANTNCIFSSDVVSA